MNEITLRNMTLSELIDETLSSDNALAKTLLSELLAEIERLTALLENRSYWNKTMNEKALERYIKQHAVCAYGAAVIKIAAQADNGWPDRLILFPGGVAAFIETKSPGDTLKEKQARKLKDLENLGFIAGWADTKEKVDEIFARAIARSGIRS
jgi:hypothetical protein